MEAAKSLTDIALIEPLLNCQVSDEKDRARPFSKAQQRRWLTRCELYVAAHLHLGLVINLLKAGVYTKREP